ncbi:hypothetical protein LMG31506_05128 [Cupriavidus yeoncheonensis]|uniref:Uncharacterized protein n=1 Tax=Cupriavidus yeoncheonensis TaxID=1462994 RepID=A0A916N665_9BURK|nr:hypothetical protein [Cupriavidus yeoncheonensis]CAG2154576.1 hypothetical protein LMG31506_05128 [Cupriavidus yeoncheonensis]
MTRSFIRDIRHVRQLAPARHALVAAMLMAMALPAGARLPSPTPEQQQAADARKAKEAEEAKHQAELLAQAQDRIAAQFGRKGAAGDSAPATEPGKVSQKAAEAPQSAGPHGGTSPSAEAHSGEAARH